MQPIDKYNSRVGKVGSLLCVGLDSELAKLSDKFKMVAFPQFQFNKWIIEQTHEFVSAYKINIAFYEQHGDKGLKELKMTMDYLVGNYPDILKAIETYIWNPWLLKTKLNRARKS